MNKKLVIFDCDGVLVDSEHISSQVFSDILADHNIDIPASEVFAKLKGGSMQESVDYVVSKLGKQPDFDITKEYRKRSFEMFRKHVKPIQGVEDILKDLTVPFCVGSNGPNNKIHLNLEVSGLKQYFADDVIFSAYDENVRAWKPDPKLFITAAKHFDIDPENCIVIEDSGHGAEAAQKAKMKCFGYTRDTASSVFEKYGAISVSSMAELKTLLDKALAE